MAMTKTGVIRVLLIVGGVGVALGAATLTVAYRHRGLVLGPQVEALEAAAAEAAERAGAKAQPGTVAEGGAAAEEGHAETARAEADPTAAEPARLDPPKSPAARVVKGESGGGKGGAGVPGVTAGGGRASDGRAALRLVGADPQAEAIWIEAINDTSLPAQTRQDLIEDLNEDGFPDPKNVTPEDLPLVVSRIWLIEELAPDAADETNAAAFAEAYKDLVNMYAKVAGW